MGLGANITATDSEGRTPLLSAARGGLVDIVKVLLKAGSDIDITNNYGETPLYAAAHIGSLAILELLIGSSPSPKLNGQYTNEHRIGWTALHAVVDKYNESTEIVSTLLDAGVDPQIANHKGETPLVMAAMKGFAETVAVFLDHPKGTAATSADDLDAAVRGAAAGGKQEILQMLIDRGATL